VLHRWPEAPDLDTRRRSPNAYGDGTVSKVGNHRRTQYRWKATRKRRRKMSAEARAKISAAQKRRWAKVKAEKGERANGWHRKHQSPTPVLTNNSVLVENVDLAGFSG
jgi:hypothetical protein